ncbi:hypothetical protein [Amycolatopsis aidingensis]|nr:hypothetical protein [Amycolatopsis aidingensis]
MGSGPHDQTVAGIGGIGAVVVVARVRVVAAARRERVVWRVLQAGAGAPG